MMKKNILPMIFLFLVFLCKSEINCDNIFKKRKDALEEKVKAPDGVDKRIYLHYLAYYGPEWSEYQVTSGKTLRVFKKYFRESPYRVIWHWDVDGCGHNDYLAVEVCPKVRRGIKRGILVDELGRIKLYIDTIKGIYAPDTKKGGMYMILDLKKLEIRAGELECFSIGYISPREEGEGRTSYGISLNIQDVSEYNKINEDKREDRKKRGLVREAFNYGEFVIQRIDKDLKVIGTEYSNINSAYRTTDFIQAIYIPDEKRSIFQLFLGIDSLNELYENKKEFIEKYRKAKKEGKAFGPPENLNSIDIEIALKLRTGNY